MLTANQLHTFAAWAGGRVLYFVAQPFGDSALAALAERTGEPANLPIWDFLLPETGGKVPVDYLVESQ